MAWEQPSTSALSSIVRPEKTRSSTEVGLPFIERGETVESHVEGQDVEGRRTGGNGHVIQRQASLQTSTLVGGPGSGVIHEDLPHGAGRHTEEVSAVLPLDALLVDELEVRLVDQGRGLKGVAGALPPHLRRCSPAKLAVDERHQLFERLRVTLAPGAQESS